MKKEEYRILIDLCNEIIIWRLEKKHLITDPVISYHLDPHSGQLEIYIFKTSYSLEGGRLWPDDFIFNIYQETDHEVYDQCIHYLKSAISRLN